MERFIDDFSKRLARATSRRDVLSMGTRTLFAAFISSTGIGRLWAHTTSISTLPGDVGGSSCGAVQQSVQLAFPDPTKFSNHGGYVSAAARSVSAAQAANLITSACSGCIVSQFAQSIPVSQQQSCGSIVSPTDLCSNSDVSTTQIGVAAVLALGAVPNAMGDAASYTLLLEGAQNILGCQFDASNVGASFAKPSPDTFAQTATDTCAAPGVEYCGPGNSANPGLPLGFGIIKVPECLNEACCVHDNCYAEVCEPSVCDFTSNVTCDNPLLATCLGFDSCSRETILGDQGALFVCQIVTCLLLPTSIPISVGGLTLNCADIQRNRLSNPLCQQPCVGSSCCPSGETCTTSTTVVPGALNGVCCPTGQTACGSSSNCCASGQCCGTTCCSPPQVCSNGTCACPSGETPCGTNCCSSTQVCSNAECLGSCPADTALCGTSCCVSGQTCSNGLCVPTQCPPGNYGCSPFGGCCRNGQPCCPPPPGSSPFAWGCGQFIGGICCPNGGACPAGNTCCSSGESMWCCSTSCGIGVGVCT